MNDGTSADDGQSRRDENDAGSGTMKEEEPVKRESASKRTAWTVRGIMLGTAGLLLLFGSWSAEGVSWNPPQANIAIPTALRWYLASIVGVLGIAALGGVLTKMDQGIRQQNLRAIGIILVAVLVTLLVIASDNGTEAALGLLVPSSGTHSARTRRPITRAKAVILEGRKRGSDRRGDAPGRMRSC